MDLLIALLAGGMGSGAVVCAYWGFKWTPHPLPDGETSLQYSRYRPLALAGLFIFSLLAVSGVTYLLRMDIYNAEEGVDVAIANYSRQIQLQPEFAEAYYNRGMAYSAKGEYDQAIEDFSHTLSSNPTLPGLTTTGAEPTTPRRSMTKL